MAVAQEPDITSYRLNQLFGYSENLTDEYGNSEIVGTSYWQAAMPLIRYKTQDLGKIINGVIHSLDGRKQEYLIAKDGSAVIGYSIRIDDFTWDYVNIYQVVQEEKGRIRIKVVPRGNFSDSIKKELLKKQQERWGGLFDIEIEVVGDIARTKAGKRRLIVNSSGYRPS
jgi:phenylacetate-CoA ligase